MAAAAMGGEALCSAARAVPSFSLLSLRPLCSAWPPPDSPPPASLFSLLSLYLSCPGPGVRFSSSPAPPLGLPPFSSGPEGSSSASACGSGRRRVGGWSVRDAGGEKGGWPENGDDDG
ncbi:hypothetical protein CDD83_6251 [Cordyceps sp. RAO-2017]|nr:hypothetical protein CDD83_6251 [Cordyceps sp. RAO-2017]